MPVASSPFVAALTRRTFLRGAGATLGLALAGCAGGALRARPRFADDPFSLGVASGSPVSDGFVLWTRLAPRPMEPGGGMPAETVEVSWVVAEDESLSRVVARGAATASPELAHSVHVELRGLAPGRVYFYRFTAGDAASRVGRTRTAPTVGAPLARLRLAFASCQHYEQGHFNPYRPMVDDDDLDLVLHLGDYIYEVPSFGDVVRRHEGPEPRSLDDYRRRHALYKTDPALQAAHAALPWVVTWDDHEVENDYAADHSSDGEPEASFHARRAAAYQAYYEHMPLWGGATPRGAEMLLYQRLPFGDLAEIFVLDGRQYRSPQACASPGKLGGHLVEGCRERLDPARTMLGDAQEAWLLRGLALSGARWNVLAQDVLMAQLDQKIGPGQAFWTDGWDGYPAERARLMAFLEERRIANPVVLGGDIHSFWVTDLKRDFDRPESPTVATEFVGTSITSAGVPYERFAAFLPENPHVKLFESRRRGYVRCDITPERWTTDLRVVESVRTPVSPVSTLATFVVENGRAGAQRA